MAEPFLNIGPEKVVGRFIPEGNQLEGKVSRQQPQGLRGPAGYVMRGHVGDQGVHLSQDAGHIGYRQDEPTPGIEAGQSVAQEIQGRGHVLDDLEQTHRLKPFPMMRSKILHGGGFYRDLALSRKGRGRGVKFDSLDLFALLFQSLQEISGAAAYLQYAPIILQVVEGLLMLPGFPRIVIAEAGAGQFLVKFVGTHNGRHKDTEAAVAAGRQAGLVNVAVLVQDYLRERVTLFPPPGKDTADTIGFRGMAIAVAQGTGQGGDHWISRWISMIHNNCQ
jgi:hypothetical protein